MGRANFASRWARLDHVRGYDWGTAYHVGVATPRKRLCSCTNTPRMYSDSGTRVQRCMASWRPTNSVSVLVSYTRADEVLHRRGEAECVCVWRLSTNGSAGRRVLANTRPPCRAPLPHTHAPHPPVSLVMEGLVVLRQGGAAQPHLLSAPRIPAPQGSMGGGGGGRGGGRREAPGRRRRGCAAGRTCGAACPRPR